MPSDKAPRILVAGCGAIGSMFGGLLRAAGNDVTLLGRAWHLDAVRADGIHIDGIWGNHHASGFMLATCAGDLDGSYNLALISVKSYDTESMVKSIAPHLDSSGLAVSLQNGLGNVEELVSAFGSTRSFGASILIGATIPQPGRVTVTVQAAPVVLGPWEATQDAMLRAESLAGLMSAASIPCLATNCIASSLWAKAFYNAALNAVGTLLDVHYGALGDDADLRAVMDGVMAEAFAVAQAQAVPLPWSTGLEYQEHFYASLLPATYLHRSSMLQDIEHGRRTEIEAINGAIWRLGREAGIATPYNELLTHLIRGLEGRDRGER
jgi:2-dehydropantoate 2-reductase